VIDVTLTDNFQYQSQFKFVNTENITHRDVQKKLDAQWAEPVSLTFHSALRKLNTVSVHMAKQFQRRRFFRNRPKRNKNCMWWPCLLTDRNEMSNLHRGHSIDASYHNQVSVVAMFANRSGRNEQYS
jgi:hypothetical protein